MDDRRITLKDLKEVLQNISKNPDALNVPETALIVGTCVTDSGDIFCREYGCFPGMIVIQVKYQNPENLKEVMHGWIRIAPPPVAEKLC